MMESNTSEKMEQSMKAMTDILSAPKKEIPRNTSLEVISIDTSDKNYNQLKKYIGKQGTAKTSLKINSEGTYSGMIEFTFDFNVINFEKVNVKIVP